MPKHPTRQQQREKSPVFKTYRRLPPLVAMLLWLRPIRVWHVPSVTSVASSTAVTLRRQRKRARERGQQKNTALDGRTGITCSGDATPSGQSLNLTISRILHGPRTVTTNTTRNEEKEKDKKQSASRREVKMTKIT